MNSGPGQIAGYVDLRLVNRFGLQLFYSEASGLLIFYFFYVVQFIHTCKENHFIDIEQILNFIFHVLLLLQTSENNALLPYSKTRVKSKHNKCIRTLYENENEIQGRRIIVMMLIILKYKKKIIQRNIKTV